MSRLRWVTAGESHGKALVGVLEGLPSGLELDLARVDAELARRQAGYGRGGRMRIERDAIELVSGTRAGRTIGAPVAFLIANRDATIEKMPVPTNPRPGHADLAGCQKHGHRDPRAVLERASARETATRVAAASLARQVLDHFGIEVFAHVTELCGIAVDPKIVEAVFAGEPKARRIRRDQSEFQALDPNVEPAFKGAVDDAKTAGDTLGGVFEVRALGVPPGLGGYASGSERLTARFGGALFSIPAIKGVEFGLGFESARRRGSEVHDAIIPAGDAVGGADVASGRPPIRGRYRRETNRAGGLEGGMTTGETVVVRAAMKPIPTLRRGVRTVDFASLAEVEASYQRSDVTSVPAASVVGEAMIALELTAAFLEKFAGDSLAEVERAFEGFRRSVASV